MATKIEVYNTIQKALKESVGSSYIDKKSEDFKVQLQEFVDNVRLIQLEPERYEYFDIDEAFRKYPHFINTKRKGDRQEIVEACKDILLSKGAIVACCLNMLLKNKGIVNIPLARLYLKELGLVHKTKGGAPKSIEYHNSLWQIFKYVGV